VPKICVALGEQSLLQGFTLAGVALSVAETDDEVRTAWSALSPEVGMVILTRSAARALDGILDSASPLTAVLPS